MNQYQEFFNAQKALFASNITRGFEWRVEQLDRMRRMISENEIDLHQAIAKDFKTTKHEYVFETLATIGEVEFQKGQLKEWMKPVEAPVPKFLAQSGHKAIIYRDPYGVALLIGPFNGPLLLLLRPAIAALAAGNTCFLKLSDALLATSALLLSLIPKYFEPECVTAISGGREETTEILKLPFDFIFFTGSTKASKHAIEAIAETMSLELQEFGIEVATINPGPFLTGFNDRGFQTWESWVDDPSGRLFDYSKLAFPRAQFDPEPVYATMTAVAAGEIDTYRNLEPKSMIAETKSNIEAPWNKKVKEGLGTRPASVQKSYEMKPETPVS